MELSSEIISRTKVIGVENTHSAMADVSSLIFESKERIGDTFLSLIRYLCSGDVVARGWKENNFNFRSEIS